MADGQRLIPHMPLSLKDSCTNPRGNALRWLSGRQWSVTRLAAAAPSIRRILRAAKAHPKPLSDGGPCREGQIAVSAACTALPARAQGTQIRPFPTGLSLVKSPIQRYFRPRRSDGRHPRYWRPRRPWLTIWTPETSPFANMEIHVHQHPSSGYANQSRPDSPSAPCFIATCQSWSGLRASGLALLR